MSIITDCTGEYQGELYNQNIPNGVGTKNYSEKS